MTLMRMATAVSLAAMLGGCGGGDPTGTLANILAFNTTRPPPAPNAPAVADSDEYCPQVEILPDGAAWRSYAGAQTSQAVRHQLSIVDVARQCTATPGGGYVLKLGVEARAVIGPAGAAGTYSAPLRVVVKRGEQVVATRQRAVSVAIPSGETGATIAIVEEGIAVPPGDVESTIEIGLVAGGAAEPRRRRR